MLDETTSVGENKAKLIEDPKRAPREARSIRVPVTVNNLVLLTQRYLKKGDRPRFRGIDICSEEAVLNQNGNRGVGPSHWSYQRTKAIGFGLPYHSQPGEKKGQQALAREARLEIVPLPERALFWLLSYLEAGTLPQSNDFERTSTITLEEDGRAHLSEIRWISSGSGFCLSFHSYFFDHDFIGAVVRVPAGSSEATSH